MERFQKQMQNGSSRSEKNEKRRRRSHLGTQKLGGGNVWRLRRCKVGSVEGRVSFNKRLCGFWTDLTIDCVDQEGPPPKNCWIKCFAEPVFVCLAKSPERPNKPQEVTRPLRRQRLIGPHLLRKLSSEAEPSLPTPPIFTSNPHLSTTFWNCLPDTNSKATPTYKVQLDLATSIKFLERRRWHFFLKYSSLKNSIFSSTPTKNYRRPSLSNTFADH